MNSWWTEAGVWWLGTVVGGTVILAITALAMRRAPSSALRQRLGECGVAAAVLLALLRLGPSWWSVPDPRPAALLAPPVFPGSRFLPSEPYELPELVQAPVAPQFKPMDAMDMPAIPVPAPRPAPVARSAPAEPVAVPPAPPTSIPIWDIVVLVYLVIAGAFLFRWGLGHWALARIIRRARPAAEPVQQLFDLMIRESGQSDVRLLVSGRVPVPLCFGMRRPVVVIPRKLALSNDHTVLRWVFAHELTHLARHDPWSTWFMGLAQAVYFFVPPFWWVRRQVRLCQEYIADAAAAAQGRWADEYAQFLVNLAGSPAAPAAATGVLAQTSDLFRRVTMVLKPTESTGREWPRRKLFTGAGCLLASAVIFAGLGVRTAGAEDDKKKEAKIIKSGDGNVQVIIVEDGDDTKKDGETKKEIKARVIAPGMGGFTPFGGHAELEKHLRKALENAKLEKDQIDRIIKEVVKAHEKTAMAFKALPAMPAIGEMPAIAKLPAGGVKFVPEGGNAMWLAKAHGPDGGGGGRLGVVIDKPGAALVEHLDLAADQGLVVVEVRKGTPAEKAGFKANDIVLRLADKAVLADPAALVKMIEGLPADKEIEAVVIRKGRKETISGIKLAEKKKAVDKDVLIGTIDDSSPKKVIIKKDGATSGDKKVEKKSRNVSISIKDGELTATETEDESTVTVTGSVDGGKVQVSSITIAEDGKKSTYKSLDRVPAKYKSRVEKLISNTKDSPVKFDFKKEKQDN